MQRYIHTGHANDERWRCAVPARASGAEARVWWVISGKMDLVSFITHHADTEMLLFYNFMIDKANHRVYKEWPTTTHQTLINLHISQNLPLI
jgi:hypothetical protein